MAEIIRMPRLSDTMEEGNIVSWLKKVGDPVKAGDILAEVETDKATMELESYFNGVLLYIGVPSGPVKVDGIIAIIGNKGEEFSHLLSQAPAPATYSASEPSQPTAQNGKQPDISPVVLSPASTDVPTPEVVHTAVDTGTRTKSSPLARALADQAGISLQGFTGSGDQGRIVKRDVENLLSNKSSIPQSTAVPVVSRPATDFKYGDVAVSQMRKTIARRLSESMFTAPHFYLTMEINMDNAVAARTDINEGGNVKISFNDFVVKACAAALRKHPAVNSSWLGDKITYHQHINIGVAVAVEDGLLVPVINNTDLKSLSQINQEVKDLAAKAKSKKLSPQEMQGNTFTVSNLGMFDIEEFTAIINPPDACIMAVGSIVKKPIVRNDEIVIGNMMKVTLSCDHRVVDGATGAQFLQTFKSMLENPVLMLV